MNGSAPVFNFGMSLPTPKAGVESFLRSNGRFCRFAHKNLFTEMRMTLSCAETCHVGIRKSNLTVGRDGVRD